MTIPIKVTLLFFFLAATSAGQTSPSSGAGWQISICPVKLISGQADFNGVFTYAVKTDENGVPTDVTRIDKSVLDRFVDSTKFAPCIKEWKLGPTEDYSINFGVGTIMFDRKPNYILVSNKTKAVKILLPAEIFEWTK